MYHPTNATPGERVKIALKHAHISQREAAKKLGYTENYISQVVRGARNVSRPIAYQIADLAGVREDWILGRDDAMHFDPFYDEFRAISVKVWAFAHALPERELFRCCAEILDFAEFKVERLMSNQKNGG